MSKKYFSVPNCGNYIYDSLTNKIITMPKTIKDQESYLHEREEIQGLSEIVWGMDEHEFVQEYHTHLKTLVLQTTQDCNLRCQYCAYTRSCSAIS